MTYQVGACTHNDRMKDVSNQDIYIGYRVDTLTTVS